MFLFFWGGALKPVKTVMPKLRNDRNLFFIPMPIRAVGLIRMNRLLILQIYV